MNTAIVPLEPKRVVSVEILHLDELGYGPQGKHTRREWRAECLENLLAGKEQFEAWQDSWAKLINRGLGQVELTAHLTFDDGSEEVVLQGKFIIQYPWILDFVAQNFQDINVSWFEFKQTTFFFYANFSGHSYFVNTIFNGFANFSHATFAALAWFESVRFKADAYFKNVTVFGGSVFDNAVFEKIANFQNANLSYASFIKATFTDDAFFQHVIFGKETNFTKSIFNKQCRFDTIIYHNEKTKKWNRETIFKGTSNFENTEIVNVGHFERVKFNGEIPNFLGVDNSKTLLIFSDDTYFNKLDTTEDAVKRIAQLKRLADEQGQTDQALMFNAFELNAKRAQARDKTQHLTWKQKANNADYWFANATAGFRIFSDYGRSFFEPLKWYLALLGVTFYLAIAHAVYFTNKQCLNEYANIFSYLWRDQIQCVPVKPKDNETPIVLSGWRAAVEYTSYRASGILDFADSDKQTIAISNRLFNQPIEPPWMRAWGIFKGIASIALLFLAALGLRNKYRIK